MKILIVHPLMMILGGGERLCCETIRVLKDRGHEVALLSGTFQPEVVEGFFGFEDAFRDVNLSTYPVDLTERFGSYKHLLHHARAIAKFVSGNRNFDLVFSTQDAGYIPNIKAPTLQWGYFPNSMPRGLYGWPMRSYYKSKIERISLVLAISQYSKYHFDQAWKVPAKLVYPPCNMIRPDQRKSPTVVTVARSVPEKRLELFWEVAKKDPNHEFVLLLTQDPRFAEYSARLQSSAPKNGHVILNPSKSVYQETLAKSMIYLHLMRGEHFGITVVEAMSAGCVPVVHDSGGPKETVGSGGILWQRETDIPRLLEISDSTMKTLSTRAIERAARFSRARFGESLSGVLEETAVRAP